MNAKLFSLIREYLGAVGEAVGLLSGSGIALPKTNRAWADLQMPASGLLSGGVRYRKHGYGCEVFLADGSVDFDFGADGQTDGFDEWRLQRFLRSRVPEDGSLTKDELSEAFDGAVASGEIIRSHYILCYLRRSVVGLS